MIYELTTTRQGDGKYTNHVHISNGSSFEKDIEWNESFRGPNADMINRCIKANIRNLNRTGLERATTRLE